MGAKQLSDHKVVTKSQLSRFVSTVSSSWNFPGSEFCLDTSIINTPLDEALLTKFIETCSAWIEKFEIIIFRGNSLANVARYVNISWNVLTSLKIAIHHENFNTKYLQGSMRFVARILKVASSIKTLVFYSDRISDVTDYFLIAMEGGQYTKLETFNLVANATDTQLSKLHRLGLKLKVLRLEVSQKSGINSREFKYFLASQSKSLEHLEVYSNGAEKMEFPHMEKLKHFSMHPHVGTPNEKILFPKIKFWNQLPQIQFLSLDFQGNFDMTEILNFKTSPAKSVVRLELPRNLEDADVISSFGLIFPNVKILQIGASKSILQTVSRKWKGLEELILKFSADQETPDQVLMSLRNFTSMQIEQFGRLPSLLLDDVDIEPLEHFRSNFLYCYNFVCFNDFIFYPFLTVILFLEIKVLRIAALPESGVKISEMCCRLVLLKFRSLEQLYLSEINLSEVKSF